MGFYGIPWIPAIKIKHFELTLFQTPMISVGTNFPWPKHSRFDVLSWLATLRTPRLCKGSSIFLPNPYDVGVDGLPLIHVFKIFLADLGPWRQRGARVCGNPSVFFAQNLYNMSECLSTPLDPSIWDLTFWADMGPPGHWGCVEVHLFFVSNRYNKGVNGLPLISAFKIRHFELSLDPENTKNIEVV